MNQSDLIATLTANSWCNSVMGIDNLNTAEANGAARMRVNFFEVVGNVATARSAQFYVINAGQENETAYWFQAAPAQSLGLTPQAG